MTQKSRTPYMDVPPDHRLAACIDDLLGSRSDAPSYLEKSVTEDREKNSYRLYDRMRDAMASLKETPADLDAFLCRFISSPLFSKFAQTDANNLLHVMETAHRMMWDAIPADGRAYPLEIVKHPDLVDIAEKEPRRLLYLLPMFFIPCQPGNNTLRL